MHNVLHLVMYAVKYVGIINDIVTNLQQ